MSESVSDWRFRKRQQAFRVFERLYGGNSELWGNRVQIDNLGEAGTTFILIDLERRRAVIFGQWQWDWGGCKYKAIDLSDDEIVEKMQRIDVK